MASRARNTHTPLCGHRPRFALLAMAIACSAVASLPLVPGGTALAAIRPPTAGPSAPPTTASSSTSPTGMRNQGDPQPSTLTVSPALVELGLDPGGRGTTTVTLSNPEAANADIRTMVTAFVPRETPNAENQARYDASSWIKPTRADFPLNAGRSETVEIVISVPADAEPGGHYATVEFQAPTNSGQGAGGIRYGSVGVILLLTVKGDIRQSISVVKTLSTERVQVLGTKSLMQVTLRNDGNVHVLPTGKLLIDHPFSGATTSTEFPTGLLLPGTERTYDVEWDHGLFKIGRYRGAADLAYGAPPMRLATQSESFYLLPAVVFGPLLIVFAFAAAFGFIALQRRRKRQHANVLIREEGGV